MTACPIGFDGVLAARNADGSYAVTLANAHEVTARPPAGLSQMSVAEAAGTPPGSRVRVEWPHDDLGGWRLARRVS
jgi:hypothetical protein